MFRNGDGPESEHVNGEYAEGVAAPGEISQNGTLNIFNLQLPQFKLCPSGVNLCDRDVFSLLPRPSKMSLLKLVEHVPMHIHYTDFDCHGAFVLLLCADYLRKISRIRSKCPT